ncbi:biotin--[acetyl-CoA-carboxylase] ligase [Nakamurella leprariae]|uniref:biotin--[biotin carboxyl-carrier protein] ligase n=1 Tax=Nakamurella leprariae TaxID=2803911 RepID=A0A939C214_9ACTN|nr:biotin--[acetyl-CoA-carboxylase] ligase [Nakamurella leprariae]MBM9467682.1 biotin--[acetyl-CoA-carboxylase] ligase [Nakamurella leprariae]
MPDQPADDAAEHRTDPADRTQLEERVATSRRPGSAAEVAARTTDPARWSISWVPATGSTNTDLLAAAAGNGPGVASGGTPVLITDEQRTGKGRSGRTWTSPPGAGLMLSVRLDPTGIPVSRWSWGGAVLGLAVRTALRDVAGIDAQLKWPNDVLIGPAKVAGILGESNGQDVVVGVGLNVSLASDELPRADATSLLLAGATDAGLDRATLAAAVLDAWGGWVDRWRAAGGDVGAAGIHDAYRAACGTVGRTVTLHLPDGTDLVGQAVDVTADGAIQVRSADGPVRTYGAADVTHLRPLVDHRADHPTD